MSLKELHLEYSIAKLPNHNRKLLMAWFKRESGELDTSGEKKVRTEGLWVKCENCRQIIWKKDLEENLNVCPKCDKHFRIDARTRLAQLLDDNQYEIFDAEYLFDRSPEVRRPEAVFVAAEAGAEGYRA